MFFIQVSDYPEGRPFPWIVSDFGLVDAIESGLFKIPRLPARDTTGRPDPAYFRLWEQMPRATPGHEHSPRSLIIVCDNTDIAKVFCRKLSGERKMQEVRAADVAPVAAGLTEDPPGDANKPREIRAK